MNVYSNQNLTSSTSTIAGTISPGGVYTLPNNTGVYGQFLMSDGAGISLWRDMTMPVTNNAVNARQTVILDSIDMTTSNAVNWNILSNFNPTNRLYASINVMHDGTSVYTSGLYGVVHIGSVNTDLIFYSDVDNGYYRLVCQNISLVNNYQIKVQRNYL